MEDKSKWPFTHTYWNKDGSFEVWRYKTSWEDFSGPETRFVMVHGAMTPTTPLCVENWETLTNDWSKVDCPICRRLAHMKGIQLPPYPDILAGL